ncbi:hypothetical protein CDD82_4029 [Ophiocordyceps australis]|uniref:Uncharacterized protein n=1 Tax=Ophiocordyceps australis TaxID=1399860 RepID=A0A2C5Z9I9_9HYPO|nr:hypothetical protein CDD82_4029 [Ophiocordyceps australis]
MTHSVSKRSVQFEASDEMTMPISKRQRQPDQAIEQETVMEHGCVPEQLAGFETVSRDASPDGVASSSSATSMRMSNRDAQGKLKSALRSVGVNECAQEAANHESVKSVRFDEQLNLEYSIAVEREDEDEGCGEEEEDGESWSSCSGEEDDDEERRGQGEGDEGNNGRGESGKDDDNERLGEHLGFASSLIQLQPVAYQPALTQSQLIAYQAMRGTTSPGAQPSITVQAGSQMQPATSVCDQAKLDKSELDKSALDKSELDKSELDGQSPSEKERSSNSSSSSGGGGGASVEPSERYDVSDDEGDPEQWQIEPDVFCLWATGVADGRRCSFADGPAGMEVKGDGPAAMEVKEEEAGDQALGENAAEQAVARIKASSPTGESNTCSPAPAPEQKNGGLLSMMSPDLPAALNDTLAPAYIGGVSRSALLAELSLRHERLERAQSSLHIAHLAQDAIAAQIDRRRASIAQADRTVRAIRCHQLRSDAWARRCAEAYAQAEELLAEVDELRVVGDGLASSLERMAADAGLGVGGDADAIPQRLLRLAEDLGLGPDDLNLDTELPDHEVMLGHGNAHVGLIENDDLESNSMF